MFRRIVLGLLLLVAVAVVAIVAASRQKLTFFAPYPPVDASADTAVIARGRYVVRSVANCASCHGDPKQLAAYEAGVDVRLSGGGVFDLPTGKLYPRNLTSDVETGLGNVPAKETARSLRYGVGHDARALLPLMSFSGLTDQDLVAVVSYLKAQAPVRNVVPMPSYSLLGKILHATVLSAPHAPRMTPPSETPHGTDVENGRYLVESVALCGACHTQHDPNTGAATGPHLGGAVAIMARPGVAETWSAPNITTDPTTGRLGSMTEDEFVARFRAGRLLPHSPMPWQGFSRMNDDDLRAIYRYLKTVTPVKHDVGPPGRRDAAPPAANRPRD